VRRESDPACGNNYFEFLSPGRELAVGIGSVKRHGFKTTELNFGVEELDPCESSGREIDFLALRMGHLLYCKRWYPMLEVPRMEIARCTVSLMTVK
jgi:hypothetical protein